MSAQRVCQCSSCAERISHGLPALRLLSVTDNDNTSALASRFAAKIFKSYYVLKHVSYHSMDMLAGRWAAMEYNSRKEFLKSVWPEIPDEHRPDFLYLREPSQKGSIQRRAFDTPQINIEDLCESVALIAFVSSRGQCPPGDFMMLDADNGNLNPNAVHFDAVLWNYFMVISGQNEAENFAKIGHVLQLKANGEDHFAEIPPIGLYTLQIQTSILTFLENCCRRILPELEHETIEEKNTAITAAQRLNNGGWHSRMYLTPNAAYLPSGCMRLVGLTHLAEGRFLAAEDHICSLVTDPEYLIEAIRATGRHLPRIDEDLLAYAKWMVEGYEKGKNHKAYDELLTKRVGPVFKTLLSSKQKKATTNAVDRLFWAKVSNWVIGDAHLQLFFWVKISTHLHAIKDLLFNCQVEPNATRLPQNIETAFCQLEHVVNVMKDLAYGSLGMGLPESKELRHLYKKGTETRMDRATIKTAVLKGKKELKPFEYRVHYTLLAMYDHGDSFHSEHAFQDEVRNMLKTDPKAADLISDWNADRILDISSALTIIRELEHFQPWVLGWRHLAAWEELHNDNDILLSDMNCIKNAAIASGTEHPIRPDMPSMKWAYGEDSEKLRLNAGQVCEAFVNSFYSYLVEAMGGDDPFISVLERLMRRLGVEESKGVHAALALAMAAMTVSEPFTQSKGKAPASTPVPIPNPTYLEPLEDFSQCDRTPINVSVRAADAFRTIAEVQPEHKTTELAFEEFQNLMDELGYDAFEMCWPGWLFYPKQGSRMMRPFFCRAPHANGGKWTAEQIRLIRGRIRVLGGMK